MQNTLKLVYARTFTHCSKNQISLAWFHVEHLEDYYSLQYKQSMLKHYQLEYTDRLPGFATESGCLAYSKQQKEVSKQHFRRNFKNDLLISSLGMGTYLGSPDITDDTRIFGAIVDSIKSGGVNHIDTAQSYRCMKSERTIGAALRYLLASGSITRDQLFIASKIGFICRDGDRGIQESFIIEKLLKTGSIKQEEIAGNCHCMNPKFLEQQLEKSLSNLGLETLDLLYIHNPVESQLPKLGQQKFKNRLAKCFEFLETQVQKGKIKNYGMATWVCFRSSPEESTLYLPLQDVLQIAEQVGGRNHHFSYVQTPINIMMPEAFTKSWQYILNDGQKEMLSLLQAAKQLKINIVSSSPLMTGSLIDLPIPDDIIKFQSLVSRHLQFIRSIPIDSLKTTLIGQKSFEHVQNNLEVIKHNPISPEDFQECIKPSRRMTVNDPQLCIA